MDAVALDVKDPSLHIQIIPFHMSSICIFAFDKEIDPRKVDEIQKLLRYVPVEAVIDRHNILPEKASPIDCGKDIWDRLYSERIKLN